MWRRARKKQQHHYPMSTITKQHYRTQAYFRQRDPTPGSCTVHIIRFRDRPVSDIDECLLLGPARWSFGGADVNDNNFATASQSGTNPFKSITGWKKTALARISVYRLQHCLEWVMRVYTSKLTPDSVVTYLLHDCECSLWLFCLVWHVRAMVKVQYISTDRRLQFCACAQCLRN